MPKNKKKFISRKNAVTFQVVHRSQQDPLIADDTAPQLVFRECPKKKNAAEEREYGIFYDDDYDYMQHLKNVDDFSTDWEQIDNKPKVKSKLKKNGEAKLVLPSSVFQSEIEESVGLLNKAAPIYGPRPELDPDIVAAMDEDFDFDDPNNVLEDNFVELANQSGSDECSEDSYEIESDNDDFEDEVDIEVKSRFTDYSMTSSVMRRNDQLTMLDDRFEKMFAKYDDNEIGSLCTEDIEGVSYINDEHLVRLAGKEINSEQDEDEVLKSKILQAAEEQIFNDEPTDLIILEKNPETWDCESILSTYSNIYNHPAKITELKSSSKIKINQKTGIPVVLNRSKLTPRALAVLDENEINSDSKSIISRISELSVRPKNETAEEKKIRKQNIKEFRRERRMEKKANTLAFTEEKKRQSKMFLNSTDNKRKIILKKL